MNKLKELHTFSTHVKTETIAPELYKDMMSGIASNYESIDWSLPITLVLEESTAMILCEYGIPAIYIEDVTAFYTTNLKYGKRIPEHNQLFADVKNCIDIHLKNHRHNLIFVIERSVLDKNIYTRSKYLDAIDVLYRFFCGRVTVAITEDKFNSIDMTIESKEELLSMCYTYNLSEEYEQMQDYFRVANHNLPNQLQLLECMCLQYNIDVMYNQATDTMMVKFANEHNTKFRDIYGNEIKSILEKCERKYGITVDSTTDRIKLYMQLVDLIKPQSIHYDSDKNSTEDNTAYIAYLSSLPDGKCDIK